MHSDVESILENTRERARSAEKNMDVVESFRDFVGVAEERKSKNEVPIISEVKPTSPTTPGVREDDPVELAQMMEDGGTSAISVLTEPSHFGGSLDNLRRIRSSVDLPVLRKDFILERRQIYEVESDLLLLIDAFLEDGKLAEFVDEALDVGFEPLVEVHTRDELENALETDARLIGVNNRDLKELEVDLSVSEALIPEIPDDRFVVAESGISSQTDVRRMVDAGADALLVGTSIMTGELSVKEKTRELVNAVKD